MMKKLLTLMLALLMAVVPAFAEEEGLTGEDTASFIHDLYQSDEEDTYNVDDEMLISFDDLFTLKLPEGWQRYDLSETQAEQNMIVCYGDGTHFMFVQRMEDDGAYADMTEYAMTLGMNNAYASIFVSSFGGQEFALYTDYSMLASACATIFHGKYVYTFYFYPLDGNMVFAQTVIDLMNTFTPLNASAQ